MPTQTPEERREYYRQWKARKLAEDPEYFLRYGRQWRAGRTERRKYKKPNDAERKRRREWYAAHRAERLAKAQAWRDTNRGKVREYYRERYAKDIEAGRARGRTNDKKRAAKKRAYGKKLLNTPQGLARWVLSQAIWRGVVTKPQACERCGNAVPKRLLHGHHADYGRPLDVEWLCSTCHGKEHRKQD